MHESKIATPENTHFILMGMGGAGGDSLVEFARACALNPALAMEVLPRAHFLLIDTDIGDLSKAKRLIEQEAAKVPGLVMPPVNTLALGQSLHSFEAVVDADERAHGWAGLDANAPLFDAVWTEPRGESQFGRRAFRAPRSVLPPSKGASQSPMISSYLFMRAVDRFDDEMEKIRERIGPASEQARVRLTFVTSLAGGTGRGCWWLASLRARRFFSQDHFPMGVFLDWSCFQDRRNDIGRDKMVVLKANSLTGFSELAMWLRLSAAETDDLGEKVKFVIPRLNIPSSTDPNAAIAHSELLASPGNPAHAADRTARYPVRRAFVVTGNNDSVVGTARQSAASILMGLLAIAKSDSSFSNDTRWFGTGMTSFAAVPLSDLKEGVNHLMRARALEASLLSMKELDGVTADLESPLRSLIEPLPADLLSKYEEFQSKVEREDGVDSGTGKSLCRLAIDSLRRKARTQTLKDALETQVAAGKIVVPKDLYKQDGDLVSAAFSEARKTWLTQQLGAESTGDLDEFKKFFIDLLLGNPDPSKKDSRTGKCRHGRGDDHFSVALYAQMLGQVHRALDKAVKDTEDQERKLDQAFKAPAVNKDGPTEPSAALKDLIKTLSGRSGIVPIWPANRYVPDEVGIILRRARFDFVVANAREVMRQHRAMLLSIREAVGRAQSRADKVVAEVNSQARESYERAGALLGFDRSLRPTSVSGGIGACVIAPNESNKSELWPWMQAQLDALRSARAARRFVLPAVISSPESLTGSDAVGVTVEELGEGVSAQAMDFLFRLSYVPSSADASGVEAKRHGLGDAGYLRTADDVENEKFRNYARQLADRLQSAAMSGKSAERFDATYGITSVLRYWARVAGVVHSASVGQSVRGPTESRFEALFGFSMKDAARLSEVGSEGELMYLFAHRLAKDNDEPVRRVPTGDGTVPQDQVGVFVPRSMQETVQNASAAYAPRVDLRASQGYAMPALSINDVASDHLILTTTWRLENKEVLLSPDCWAMWESFRVYSEPEVLNKYLADVDDEQGASVFRERNGAVGLGYAAPMFLRRAEFASRLWRPWRETTAAPRDRRRAFALLYGMMGITEGLNESERSSREYIDFIAELGTLELSRDNPGLRWSMPLLTFQFGNRKEKAWTLTRSPYALVSDSGLAVDFREPDRVAQSKLKGIVKDHDGPVEFARAFESGKLDALVTALLEEQAILLSLAKRSPLMDCWTDGIRRHVCDKLCAVIVARRAEIGTTNKEHQKVQEKFFNTLLEELDRLKRSGRGVLDTFVP
jgi:Tubulin like